MESVLGRYKNLIVLVVVLFVQVFGLAVQVKRTTDTESTRLIRLWSVSAITPFEKALVWIENGTRNIWHNYFYLRGVRAENRELKQQIEQLRLEQVRLNEDAEQARRLQKLLSFKEQYIEQTVPAQVIGSSGSQQSRIIYIDKGEKDGLKPDMAVITTDGIVGKVLKVYGSTCQVLLIDDQSSGVGAILEKSRLQGILRGSAGGEVVLEKVMSDEQVQPGDKVLTSGGDRIFPKGLPVGTVTKVSSGPELFLNIRVRPSAHLGKLEEVLVVTKIVEKESAPSATGPMRAVDILAKRLPSVPDKPADGAASAGFGSQPAGAGTQSTPAPHAVAPDAARTNPGSVVSGTKPASSSASPAKPAVSNPAAPSPAPSTAGPLKPAVAQSPVKVHVENADQTAKPKPNSPPPDGQGQAPPVNQPPQ